MCVLKVRWSQEVPNSQQGNVWLKQHEKRGKNGQILRKVQLSKTEPVMWFSTKQQRQNKRGKIVSSTHGAETTGHPYEKKVNLNIDLHKK